MTGEEWALAAAVVFAGLWSGLLGMLTLVMHGILGAMDGPGFLRLHERVPPGRQEGLVQLLLRDRDGRRADRGARAPLGRPGSAAFMLTAIGLGFVIIGVYVVSNVWKEPHYDVMLAWDPEAMPPGWEAGRQKYFTINWIQLVSTWAASDSSSRR